MFSVPCSIYAHAKDTYGEYFDHETGEVIRQMCIGDFLLTDQWKPQVTQLHALIKEYGVKKAKKLQEYQDIKRSLPGATLSGVFGTHRRTAECIARTGFIALDIDTGDNDGIMNWDNIRRTLRYRPEVALLMHSCSGQGFLALARLAYPDNIKEQFNALYNEYRALGITLDRACSDITRLRFATWDPDPYVNTNAIPYMGMMLDRTQTIAPQAVRFERREYSTDPEDIVNVVAQKVARIEARSIDITGTYDDCFRLGVSLATLGPIGLEFWKRICRFRSAAQHEHFVTDKELEHKWRGIGNVRNITIGTFFAICKDNGI